ncbi:MAG: hypothetical protein ACE5GW_08445, partial [Planctomycetota bacterium]
PRLAGWTVCDGTNADDAAADRPGITAAGDVGVISPLREARIGKAEIRKLASELGLPNRERPSRPCLASRVRVGTPVDAATLRRVAALEGILERAGFRIYRARTCGDEVTVVLGGDEMARLGEPGWRHELVCEALRQGYRRIVVDLLGYRPPGERGEESGEREEQPRPL